MVGYESAGIILEEGVLNSSKLSNVSLTNINLSYTSFGIKNVNKIDNININNINLSNIASFGFQFDANTTNVNIGMHNMTNVVTPYSISGNTKYFNTKSDGLLLSGYIAKADGNEKTKTSTIYEDNNGNVGIGTTTPSFFSGFKTFTLSGNSGSLFQMRVNNLGAGYFFSDANGTNIEDQRNKPLTLKTNGQVRITIKGNGIINYVNTPIYETIALAKSEGGLVAGDRFKTSAGVIMEVN